ncbi:MAG: phosphonate ABC transporter ATP-binding protein [Lachnospiraceae bacterium]
MSVLLEIKDLKKHYGSVRALDGVDCTIEKGEFVVVIGPSGAGKSTFIRCINRLIDPTSGEIRFNGDRIEKIRGEKLRNTRRKIGMIFQHYNLVDRTNVLKNVLHGRLGYMPPLKSLFQLYDRDDRKHAVELLERVGIKDQMYKRADELSGGQKQRVGICRALIQDPQILLADEPIASLDPKSAKVVMDTLYQITREKGLSVVVNLHQVDFAKTYATRIIGLKNGKKIFDGKPEELTEEMIHIIYEGKEDQMKLKESVA